MKNLIFAILLVLGSSICMAAEDEQATLSEALRAYGAWCAVHAGDYHDDYWQGFMNDPKVNPAYKKALQSNRDSLENGMQDARDRIDQTEKQAKEQIDALQKNVEQWKDDALKNLESLYQ